MAPRRLFTSSYTLHLMSDFLDLFLHAVSALFMYYTYLRAFVASLSSFAILSLFLFFKTKFALRSSQYTRSPLRNVCLHSLICGFSVSSLMPINAGH